MKNTLIIIVMYFLFMPFLYSKESIPDTTNYLNIVKMELLFGAHIPDEEFSEGYSGALTISNSINKYAFFTFDFNYDRFYGINEHKKKYEMGEISMGIGIFFNFLRFKDNVSYIGIELGVYHIKNTDDIKLNTSNAGNNLMIVWMLGHSYSITHKVDIEGLVKLKANHLRNLSVNLGIGYKIFK